METGADTGHPVPYKAVQHILNGVIAIFVCYDRERRHQLLFTGQAIVLLKVKEQIFDIGIGQGAGASAGRAGHGHHVGGRVCRCRGSLVGNFERDKNTETSKIECYGREGIFGKTGKAGDQADGHAAVDSEGDDPLYPGV